MTTKIPDEIIEGLDVLSLKRMALFHDEKADGVDGGTAVAGGWFDRDLNTEKFNNIPGLSLDASTGQLTVPAGTFKLKASPPVYRCNQTQHRWVNVTDGVNYHGAKDYVSANSIAIRPPVIAIFELASPKVFKLQYRAQTTTTDGLGQASTLFDGTPGVFTIVEVEKLD